MKVLAITSALLVACSSAAAIAGPTETYQTTSNDALKARDAEAAAAPGWWGFRWSRHGRGGWKRDAAPAPEAMPGWWGFRWSGRGRGGWKRDVANAGQPDEDFIYLPKGMTPDDLAAMMKDAQSETAPDAAKTEETKA